VFKGTVYNRFLVTWSTPEAWTSATPGNLPGVVRGGEEFHVGASFFEEDILNTSTQVVISDATLISGGVALPLHPRVPTFNSGTLGADGSFRFTLANLAAVNLLLRNLQAWVLPRQIDIQSMIVNAAGQIDLFDVQGQPVVPWRTVQLPAVTELPAGSPEQPAEASFVIGNLFKDGHNVHVRTSSTQRDAVGLGEVNPPVNNALLTDPYPGASVLVTGDLVEPGAVQWDPVQQTYVAQELVTHVYLQMAGKRAKPVEGSLIGLLRSKVTCSNLNSRLSVSAAPDANGSFDCEKAGLLSLHGDRVQLTQTGLSGATALPAVQVSGLAIAKVVCTNLNSRLSVSFAPATATDPLDCAKAGLAIQAGNTVELTQIGTVR
jgi:hypothetical protein